MRLYDVYILFGSFDLLKVLFKVLIIPLSSGQGVLCDVSGIQISRQYAIIVAAVLKFFHHFL